MRSLSKQNFKKCIELYRFLYNNVNLYPKNYVNFAQKKKFLQKTLNFKIPIYFNYEQKEEYMTSEKLMENIYI